MRRIPKYVPKWLLICSILFMLVTIAHGLGIMIQDDMQHTIDVNSQFGEKGRQDSKNESTWDISGTAGNVFALLTGADMPMPFPIIITIFNGIMLTVIAFCISEIIKAWLPLV